MFPGRRVLLLALAAAVSAGCRTATATPVRVSAAVSLTESLTAAVRVWERETGESALLNFAASNVLSRQIEEGAPVDLFVSADAVQMERLVVGGLIEPATVVPLLTNQLAVVTPSDRPIPGLPEGLADRRVARIALGDPDAVPAGVYARQWLQRIGLWPLVAGKVLPMANVRAALGAVEAGNADAAVVYRTDAIGRPRVHVAYEVPAKDAPPIVYPAAVVGRRSQSARARALLSWLQTDPAQRIFAAAGFGRHEATASR